jgi:hypothetical protein
LSYALYYVYRATQQEGKMGYRILNISEEFRAKFTEREGLEGPFFYDGNDVLYYDPQAGAYYDPRTDLHLTYNEYVERTANV